MRLLKNNNFILTGVAARILTFPVFCTQHSPDVLSQLVVGWNDFLSRIREENVNKKNKNEKKKEKVEKKRKVKATAYEYLMQKIFTNHAKVNFPLKFTAVFLFLSDTVSMLNTMWNLKHDTDSLKLSLENERKCFYKLYWTRHALPTEISDCILFKL